jgi:dTDP-4-dehydrorhamnose reductase
MGQASPPNSPRQSERASHPEVWAGIECTRVRIGRRRADQLDLTGHRERIADIDLVASLGVTAIRYPVLWEHVAPNGLERADWRWTDERMERLRSHGIRPIVGLLHHGSGPRGMSMLHPRFVAAFANYARAVAQRYPWVTEFIPINEPLTTARFGGLYGWWQPHQASREMCARLLLVQCAAIRAAARAIREVNPGASIIVNEDVGRTFATPPLADLAAHLNERRWLTWDVLFGRVNGRHPMYAWLAGTVENTILLRDLTDDPCRPDILGVDHYVTSDRFLDHRVNSYIPERRGAGDAPYVDVEACRVPGVPTRSVTRAIRDTWVRYRAPMALTEISLAGDAHDQVAWWNEAWRAASSARASGIDIRAVTAWALFGAVDWHCLMRRPEGIYEPGPFDVRLSPPATRPVAAAIAAAARLSGSRRAEREAAAADAWIFESNAENAATRPTGWWTRRDRFTLTI